MILITGATGYIGKDLVKRLGKKDDIRILTRADARGYPFEVVRGDITEPESVEKAMKDVDYVVHLAADKNHLADYKELFGTNVTGTENVMKIAVKNDVKKVVYLSSMAAVIQFKTGYGKTKRTAEKVIENHWDSMDIPVIRTDMVYDLERLEKLRKVFMLPMTTRNFKMHPLYKESLMEIIETALKKGKSDYYDVGDEKPVFFHDLHRAVLNTGLKPLYVPHFLIGFGVAFSYVIKHAFNLMKIDPLINPEFIEHLFQDREFDISYAVKKLGYKPVDTIKTIKELYKGELSKSEELGNPGNAVETGVSYNNVLQNLSKK